MANINEEVNRANARFSFAQGWSLLQQKDLRVVRTEITAALGLKNRQNFYPRLKGEIEPKVSEAQAIEEIFAKRGISRKKVWGPAITEKTIA